MEGNEEMLGRLIILGRQRDEIEGHGLHSNQDIGMIRPKFNNSLIPFASKMLKLGGLQEAIVRIRLLL